MPYVGIFGLIFKKKQSHIVNQQPQICQTGKICQKKQKCLTLGPNLPYFRIFGLNF